MVGYWHPWPRHQTTSDRLRAIFEIVSGVAAGAAIVGGGVVVVGGGVVVVGGGVVVVGAGVVVVGAGVTGAATASVSACVAFDPCPFAAVTVIE